MMKIEHIAIWAKDLEVLKMFYVKYFDMQCGDKYINEKKKFSSYFLSFNNSPTRIEIMHRPDVEERLLGLKLGFTHIAISVGSREKVETLTEQLRADNFEIVGEPRTTGDGYYESVILDPEGNQIEITI